MNKLTSLLLEAGLLQFGWFDSEGIPFRLSLDMLPAYPDILAQIITEGIPHTTNMNRLVCTMDALPFGVGLSLQTNIPLVYSRGSGAAPFHDLIGAYDIGHPALLLVNMLDGAENPTKLINKARNVGLQIHHVLTVVDLGIIDSLPDVRLHSLIDFDAEIAALMYEGRLTVRHGNAVINWLNRKRSV